MIAFELIKHPVCIMLTPLSPDLFAIIFGIAGYSLALSVPAGQSLYPPTSSLQGSPPSLLVTPASQDSSDDGSPSILTPNITIPQYDIFPTLLNTEVQCDGGRYGVNVDFQACSIALSKIGNNATSFSAVQRGTRARKDVALPHRWSSRECLYLVSWPSHNIFIAFWKNRVLSSYKMMICGDPY